MYRSAAPKRRHGNAKTYARFHPVVGPFFFGVSPKDQQHNRPDKAESSPKRDGSNDLGGHYICIPHSSTRPQRGVSLVTRPIEIGHPPRGGQSTAS
jgi:hypothetical protein